MTEIKVVSSASVSDLKEFGITQDKLLSMLRKMILARRFEEKVEELYLKMALITGPCHLYLGMEAIAAGSSEATLPDDYLLATYRGHGHAVVKGVPPEKVFAELMGRVDGTCKGLGGSMHAATWTKSNIMLATAIVGSNIPVAAGVGLAIKKKALRKVAVCFFGDGAVNSGAFNEGINLAAVLKVPVVYVCENNEYALSMTEEKGTASKSIADRAASYEIPTFIAEGNDPVSVYKAVSEARKICLSGGGPCFIEARTYRMGGHGIYDRGDYMPSEEVKKWAEKDPIAKFEQFLLKEKAGSQKDIDRIDADVRAEIDAAAKKARSSPYADYSTLEGLVYPGRED